MSPCLDLIRGTYYYLIYRRIVFTFLVPFSRYRLGYATSPLLPFLTHPLGGFFFR